MVWNAVPTFVSGNVLTAAQQNILGGNLNETAVGLASSMGQYPVASGANQLAMRTANSAVVDVSQSTSSASYADLATAGPSVTVSTGTEANVSLYSTLFPQNVGSRALTTFEVSGATTQAANDNRSLYLENPAATVLAAAFGMTTRCTGLTSGSNTFKMVYKVGGGGSAIFDHRRIAVHPY